MGDRQEGGKKLFLSYKHLVFGHAGLIKNIEQTAEIDILETSIL